MALFASRRTDAQCEHSTTKATPVVNASIMLRFWIVHNSVTAKWALKRNYLQSPDLPALPTVSTWAAGKKNEQWLKPLSKRNRKASHKMLWVWGSLACDADVRAAYHGPLFIAVSMQSLLLQAIQAVEVIRLGHSASRPAHLQAPASARSSGKQGCEARKFEN